MSGTFPPINSQEEELESLQAIYCKPQEFDSWKSPEGQYVVIQFDFKPPHLEKTLKGGIRVLLTPDYPFSCPKEMTVLCNDLPESTLHSVKLQVGEKAECLKGESMLLELVCFVQELFEISVTCCNDDGSSETLHSSDFLCIDSANDDMLLPTGQSNTFTSDKCKPVSTDLKYVNCTEENNFKSELRLTSLLQLDHMRSKQSYIKLIRKWTSELNLSGRLLFYGKFIFIILQGHNLDIKEYIVRNKTMIVDVDSKGRPCKERMLSVLCEDSSDSFKIIYDFKVVDNIPSFEEFSSLFQSFSMTDLFKAYIEPLCLVKSKKNSVKK